MCLFFLFFFVFGVSTQSCQLRCVGAPCVNPKWATESVVLGAMAARSRASRRTAGELPGVRGLPQLGLQTQSTKEQVRVQKFVAVANAELEIAHGPRGCFDFNAVIPACLNLLRLDGWRSTERRSKKLGK